MWFACHLTGTHGITLAMLHNLNACILRRHVLVSNPLYRFMHCPFFFLNFFLLISLFHEQASARSLTTDVTSKCYSMYCYTAQLLCLIPDPNL
jgi:hypothetical protein